MDDFITLKEDAEKACAQGEFEKAEQIIAKMNATLETQQSGASSSFSDQASALIGASAVSLILGHTRAGNLDTAARIIDEISRTRNSNGQPLVNTEALTRLLSIMHGGS